MGRPPREKNDPHIETTYHTWTRVVQQKFYITPEDKEKFLEIIAHLQKTYFVELIEAKPMDNHVHVIIKIYVPEDVSIEELERRFKNLYPRQRFPRHKAQEYKEKWGDLSQFMKSLNERFAKYMNAKYGWKGHFWAERFGSNILADEEAVLNCLAYVDLNYANVSNMPPHTEPYYYGGIPYILQTQNAGNLFSISSIAKIANLIYLPEKYLQKIEHFFGDALDFLSPSDRRGYIKYLGFVYLRYQERDFMKKAKDLAKRGILGSLDAIEAIIETLNCKRARYCYQTELSPTLYRAF